MLNVCSICRVALDAEMSCVLSLAILLLPLQLFRYRVLWSTVKSDIFKASLVRAFGIHAGFCKVNFFLIEEFDCFQTSRSHGVCSAKSSVHAV